MSKPLHDVRSSIEDWMRSEAINVAADVVPPQGVVESFSCQYHQNFGKGVGVGLTLATVVFKVYVSRAHEDSGHERADDAQSTLQESLESHSGPWTQLQVMSSDVTEETRGEATFVAVRFTTQIWV